MIVVMDNHGLCTSQLVIAASSLAPRNDGFFGGLIKYYQKIRRK